MSSRTRSATQVVQRPQSPDRSDGKPSGNELSLTKNTANAASDEQADNSDEPSNRCTREKKIATGKRKISRQDKSKNECEMCGERFSSSKSLDSHRTSAHKGWNEPLDSLSVPAGSEAFPCSVCNNAYRCQAALTLHSKTHARYPYTCNFCGTGVSRLETLQKHRMEHSQVFQCDCGKVFSCRKSLQRHKKAWCASAKRKHRVFYCPVCNELFASVNLRKKHIEEKHLGFTTCKKCGMDFSSSELHSKHVCSDNSSDLRYFCDSCPKRFISYSKLLSHMHQTHQQVETRSKRDTPMADIAAESEPNSKSKEDLFTEFFVSVKKDGKKKNKYNSLCEIKCDHCPKIFTCRYAFQNHKLFHAGDKSLTCKYCGKTLSHKGSLMSHLRIHQGDRPFICEVCGKKFVEKSQLTRHVRIHTGERPYICDKCGQTFNQPSSLKTHLRTHDQQGTIGGVPLRRARRAPRSGGPVPQKKRMDGNAATVSLVQDQGARPERLDTVVTSTSNSFSSAVQPCDAQNSYHSQQTQCVQHEQLPPSTVVNPAVMTTPSMQTAMLTPHPTSSSSVVPAAFTTQSSMMPGSVSATLTQLVPVAPSAPTAVTVPSLMPPAMTATNPALLTSDMSMAVMNPVPMVPVISTGRTNLPPVAPPMSDAMTNHALITPAMATTHLNPSPVVPAMSATATNSSAVAPGVSGVVMTSGPSLPSAPLGPAPHCPAPPQAPAVGTPPVALVLTFPPNMNHSILQLVAPRISHMVSELVLGAALQFPHCDSHQLAGSVGHSVSQRLAHQMAALASEELPRLMVEFFHYVSQPANQSSS